MSYAVNELAVRARSDSTHVQPLWESVSRFVALRARKYARYNATRLYDTDDLMQAAYLALVDAVESYEPERGSGFLMYLTFHLRRHFEIVAGRRGTKTRPEVHALSLDEYLEEENNDTYLDLLPDPAAAAAFDAVIEHLYNDQLADALDDCLSRLEPVHAAMIRARFYEGKTINEIAAERSLTYSAARAADAAALRHLRIKSNLERLKEFKECIISAAYKPNGYQAFLQSGSSTVERAVEAFEEAEKRFAPPDE